MINIYINNNISLTTGSSRSEKIVNCNKRQMKHELVKDGQMKKKNHTQKLTSTLQIDDSPHVLFAFFIHKKFYRQLFHLFFFGGNNQQATKFRQSIVI